MSRDSKHTGFFDKCLQAVGDKLDSFLQDLVEADMQAQERLDNLLFRREVLPMLVARYTHLLELREYDVRDRLSEGAFLFAQMTWQICGEEAARKQAQEARETHLRSLEADGWVVTEETSTPISASFFAVDPSQVDSQEQSGSKKAILPANHTT